MKKIIAFYDALCFSIVAGVMWTVALILLIECQFSNFNWLVQNWYLALVFAICFAVPVTMMFCLQKIEINLSHDKVECFYLVNFAKNERDIESNWNIYPSEIESIEVVRLSKEEKRKYTSARFLFNKYLKIIHKYGHCKYVYVSHYSNCQIKKIIKILTQKKLY